MHWLVSSILFLFFTLGEAQQSCLNYGISNGSSCACPPGFGGPTCSQPACGGDIFQGGQRSLVQTTGTAFPNITGCSCTSGWIGTGCNVCQTAQACQLGYNSSSLASSSSPDLTLNPDETENTTMICNTSPQVWAAGEMSCQVNNPTLQAIYPLSSTLNILRTLQPSLTPIPGASGFGNANTMYAQLWYDGVEQFYCDASNCTQSNSDGSSDWSCNNLQCTCIASTTFCGAVSVSNLTETINSLTGTIDVNCNAPSSSTGESQCYFKQTLLESLFGSDGLSLSGCSFGECVRQAVIDSANGTSTTAVAPVHELSGGVIAGLAVVGAFIVAAALLMVWGWIAQRAARRSGSAVVESKGDVGIMWDNIEYSVSSSSSLWPWPSRKQKNNADIKLILDGISGAVEPGKMLGILGPSGAGKSTLVDLLAGKRKFGYTSGKVNFFSPDSGVPIKVPRIGFVDQADVLPANLTVREALLFAARLRLSESVPDSAKVTRVFEVMDQLGLSDLSDVRIGSLEHRGISGGEMRRLSIGLELVAAPDILILDEPTSGLDSVSALKVATVLHDLAQTRNTVVIASIHQPSSKLYRMFDQILLLSGGHQLYFGEGGIKAADYFASQGLPCQEGYNVADHLLDIASDPPPALLNKEAKVSISNFPASDVHISLTEKGYPPTPNPSPNGFSYPATKKSGEDSFFSKVTGQYSSTSLTQFQVLSWREWKNLQRDKTLFFAHIGISAVLGVFCGGLYYKTGITIAGFQSRIGSLFFLGSLIAFSSLSALYNIVAIRPLFLRERAGSYYSPASWLLSRVVFDVVPLRVIPALIVSTITYWMAGLSPDAAHFFKFLLILVLYTLAMTLFNFLLACLFRNGGIAILLSAIFNLYIMTYAGFFVHLDSIPPVLRWLQWFSILKYCLEALSVNEVNSGLMIVDSLGGVPVDVSAELIMQLLFGFGENNYYRDVLVLFAFIAGFGVFLLSVVFFMLRERR